MIISCLDPQKASGSDDSNHHMVIATANTICRLLCKLFNLSLRKKCFPSFWKLASVTAVFKKSVKSITSNYRPISLLSCVSRIFERTVFKYVFSHISGHKYKHKHQSGFLTGYSTSHQLVEIYYCIMTAFENQTPLTLTFFDVSNAFDHVWIRGLFINLSIVNFKNLNNLLIDILSNSTFQIIMLYTLFIKPQIMNLNNEIKLNLSY